MGAVVGDRRAEGLLGFEAPAEIVEQAKAFLTMCPPFEARSGRKSPDPQLARALTLAGAVDRADEVQAAALAMARGRGDQATLMAMLMVGLTARWRPERIKDRLVAGAT